MASYCTATEVKAYMGGTFNTADSTLMEDLVGRASAMIDGYTNNSFAPASATMRPHDIDNVDGRILTLNGYLATLTGVTNGDGVAVNIADIIPLPRNRPPFYELQLKSSSPVSWVLEEDYAIEVTGKWGYSETVPDDVKQAAIELSAYLFVKRKSIQDVATQKVSLDGTLLVPSGIPKDVTRILNRYRVNTLWV